MKFIILMCLYWGSVFAQENLIDPDNSKAINEFIGEIVFAKGQITKIRTNEEIVAAVKGKILTKDKIKTGKASFVKVKMLDDTVLSFGPETEFEFSKFVLRSKDDRQSVYNFVKGQIRAHFPVKAKEGDIEFKTKTTSMGIRGTTLLSNIQKNGTKETTEYLLLEGKIEVNNLITKTKTMVDPGTHYILNSDGEQVEEEESIQIAPEILSELQSLSKDELNDLKPLLPFSLYKKIKQAMNGSTKNSGRTPASIMETPEESDRPTPVKNKANKIPKWKKTLDDLNTQLKNNRTK